jgi:hypothetical protein
LSLAERVAEAIEVKPKAKASAEFSRTAEAKLAIPKPTAITAVQTTLLRSIFTPVLSF